MKLYQVTVTWSTQALNPGHSRHYCYSLEKALSWAKTFIQLQRQHTSATYLKTEIKEFEFVQDIPVDF